jgi:hypothetical protein
MLPVGVRFRPNINHSGASVTPAASAGDSTRFARRQFARMDRLYIKIQETSVAGLSQLLTSRATEVQAATRLGGFSGC